MTEFPRERLPNRRLTLHSAVVWKGAPWLISAGFDREGVVREVFVDPESAASGAAKVGSDLRSVLEDGCILISRSLQRGERVADLAKALSREGAEGGANASPLGLIAARLVEIEASDAQAVQEAYEAADKNVKRRGA